MNPLNRLRFKIVTSFAIAALGAITFARLASVVPFSLSLPTLMPFMLAGIFVIAGIWRGFIYLHAVRSLAKS